MPELTLVGLSEDGRSLVLSASADQTFTVPVDERLRAAVVSDRVRLGQLELELGATLRPKEIQARIRAGAPVEEVAAAAGVGVERIMRYAGPVLSERQHVATQAQRSVLRRPDSGSGPKSLADVVGGRLQQRGLSGQAVAWDAWRRDDGKWTVTAAYRSGERERTASFVYDPPARVVVAGDDEARWLSGESGRLHGPQPRTSGQRRRGGEGGLSVVGSGESELFDQEAPDRLDTEESDLLDADDDREGGDAAAALEDDNPTVTLAPVNDDTAADRTGSAAVDDEDEDEGDVGLAIFRRRDERTGVRADEPARSSFPAGEAAKDEPVADARDEEVAADELAELDEPADGRAGDHRAGDHRGGDHRTGDHRTGDVLEAEQSRVRARGAEDDEPATGGAAPGEQDASATRQHPSTAAGDPSAAEHPPADGSPAAEAGPQPAAGSPAAESPTAEAGEPTDAAGADEPTDAADEPTIAPATQRPKRRSRKRAEVPSWDDILFGTKSD